MAPIHLESKDWESVERGDESKALSPSGRSPKVSPTKLIATVVLFLVALNFLQKPIAECYQRVSDHVCGPRSMEERAHRVLKTTPLIGRFS